MTSPGSAASVRDLAGLAALDDPVRRRLYEYVCAHDEPVGRDAAAGAASISRSLAAYHLDKLVEHGMLSVSFRRPDGRAGPGAGRPAKLYERAQREIAVSVPSRDYELAASLLAQAVDEGVDAARVAARRHGRQLAGAYRDRRRSRQRALELLLREQGYEPVAEPDGTLRLRNCPFDAIARSHPGLVCGLNLALVEGILDGLQATGHRARLEPQPGRCCVAVRTVE